MKHFTLVLLVFLTCRCLAGEICVVNGSWQRGKVDKVSLYRVDGGRLEETATSAVAADGSFHFAFSPGREGLYVIGISPGTPANDYFFYFKPGDRLNVAIDAESYSLIGKNTRENEEMARWHEYILPLEKKAFYDLQSTYEDFFPLLEEKMAGSKEYKQIYVKNKTFNACFEQVRRHDLWLNALSFLYSPRTKHPRREEYASFYRTFDITAATVDGSLLEYPHGKFLLDLMCTWKRIQDVENLSPEEQRAITLTMTVESLLPVIGHELVKGAVVAEMSSNVRTYDEMLAYEERFGHYLATPAQRDKVKNRTLELLKAEKEQRTVDFKFRDAAGNEVALSDFKGSVVYVDVWATWCGPCKAEIPHLKRVEEEYHGKLVFMSVSVDAGKDLQKWQDFVATEKLGGVQLFAGDKSREILEPYQIKGIPRFMLFGKDGKVILADAPRPSDERLEAELDKALAR
jgi:thiol-disulfide isomerase/thioredoxin